MGFMFYVGHTEQVARYVLSRQSRYQLVGGEYLHAGEGAPALAEVLDGGTYVIDRSVDAEEAVVRLAEGLDLYRSILGIVAVEVETELPADLLGVDGGGDTSGAFVEQREDGVVHVVVDEEYARLGTLDQVGNEGVGIVNLSVVEDALCRGRSHADVEVELLLLAGLGILNASHALVHRLLQCDEVAVDGVALEEIFTQHHISPTPELYSLAGLNPIPNGQYDIKIVILHLIHFAIIGSCRKFCDNLRIFVPNGRFICAY